ncbi:MAG TPA: ABC transporter permease subunit, partial [Tepidisphaeraceae bacterium]|nr:ABC transporter permease subunit [Tepidisphaeraceae bacterium]
YLGLLVALVTMSILTSSGSDASTSLADLAKESASLFTSLSYLQLALVALLAPIFTAGAITQEKDSQTYDILLSTPLTNGQIVLGSLTSRLFFVFALLLSGIPIFSITQIFGGVSISSIVQSFLIAAVTALVTGAMAMAIATLKIGTRRTIFSFYLFIVIYLVGFYLLDQVSAFQVRGYYPRSHISWFTGIHPFLALQVVFKNPAYTPPDIGTLVEIAKNGGPDWNYWPVNWYLTNPVDFYITAMLLLSLIMVLPSIVLLRRLAQSTVSLRSVIIRKLTFGRGKTRKPRAVWHNPIAWREARTKASAARATFMRFSFIAAGMIGAVTLLILYCSPVTPDRYILPGSFNAAASRLFIQSDDPSHEQAATVSSDLAVKLNGVDIDDHTEAMSLLNGTFEVASVSTNVDPVTNLPRITGITLNDYPRRLPADSARQWLLGIVMVEFAVILLVVTNAAASTVTREKEDGTLDLLLTTPITSRYYIWGKLRGLVSFVLPLAAVPVASALIFVVHDICVGVLGAESDFHWIVLPEAVLIMPAMLIIVVAFASILGMQMSLRCRTTVWAVMSSILIMAGACGALGWCGFSLMDASSRGTSLFSLGMSTFSPFTLMAILIDPYSYGGSDFDFTNADADPVTARIVIFIVSAIAVAAYALAVWTMYKSMVKNFDMTIRRQSR